jgi:hypothetical protein
LMSDAARHSSKEAFSSLIIAVALEALRRRVGVGGRLPYSRRGALLDWVLMPPESSEALAARRLRPSRTAGSSLRSEKCCRAARPCRAPLGRSRSDDVMCS